MGIAEHVQEQLENARRYTEEDLQRITDGRLEAALEYVKEPPSREVIEKGVREQYPIGDRTIYVIIKRKSESEVLKNKTEVMSVLESEFEDFDSKYRFSHRSEIGNSVPTFMPIDE